MKSAHDAIPKHIPDEYIANWQEMDTKTLIDLLEKLKSNVSAKARISPEDAEHYTQILEWMEQYVHTRIENDPNVDPDIFLR